MDPLQRLQLDQVDQLVDEDLLEEDDLEGGEGGQEEPGAREPGHHVIPGQGRTRWPHQLAAVQCHGPAHMSPHFLASRCSGTSHELRICHRLSRAGTLHWPRHRQLRSEEVFTGTSYLTCATGYTVKTTYGTTFAPFNMKLVYLFLCSSNTIDL